MTPPVSSPEPDSPPGPFQPVAQQPLHCLCSMGVGGPAQYFYAPADLPQLLMALSWARTRALPLTVLGGGSNVIIHDDGLAGLVIKPAFAQLDARPDGSRVHVRVGAGVLWDHWVKQCVANGWAGVECLSGIPGNVGASPIQNIGAYGQEVSQIIKSVEVFDREQQQVRELSARQCQFGYRSSLFKLLHTERYIVLSVDFRLSPGPPAAIRYGQLSESLAASAPPSLTEIREAVLAIRRQKSMVLDSEDPNTRSCGSFFLNPVLDQACLDTISAATGDSPPRFALAGAEGSTTLFKVPAAWLIERSGIQKGQRFGDVGISSRHSLALVCHPGATARQVVAAARTVQNTVQQKLGVTLRPEPRFLGFPMGDDGLPLPP